MHPLNGDSKIGSHASAAWLAVVTQVISHGREVAPRGMRTLEIPHGLFQMNMSHPVVLCPARKLHYTFLAAEALWILSGDDRVETIAKYNPKIAEFSDDGRTFAGAYGAPILTQFDYVVETLLRDRDTRQAVMTIWRPNPPPSKDIPCTVAIVFSIRKNMLSCHVYMRSSDIWLGLPYDVFNFTMLAAKVACAYNARRRFADLDAVRQPAVVTLGWLYLTAVSSHLYARDFESARVCVEDGVAPRGEPLPEAWITEGDWSSVEASVVACRDKAEAAGPNWLWRVRP